ncbi:MAG: hypothetical protein KC931_27620, partial [Candidatus Omnitrophica bacterium]|nr:hypothetical protein [Candidatus Omnitrophota bacterium]
MSSPDFRGSLPPNPSLRHLKLQAKELLKSARQGDSRALDRVGTYANRRHAVTLADAQLTIAREYG